MKRLYIIVVFLILAFCLSAYHADIKFADSWNKKGLIINEQSNQNLKLNYSITHFNFKDIDINNENLTNIHLPGVFLPNDEGMPNLPGISHYIAIPQGAKAELNIIDYRIERYSDIEIAPAPRIPLDTEDGPLEYSKNNEIYSMNANYPENFIKLSEPSKLRGVDVVMLGITPFQYNPVSKELTVYRDIKFEVSFSGGNGHFGEDRLRNRWWDPIIKDTILNQSILPDIDYNSRELSRDGAEYLIICQNDPDFLAWADSIKVFRQQQGISTMIVTTADVGGNTVSAIQAYVDDAYGNWDTPPAAVLLLGDYGTGTSGIVSEWYTHPAGYPDFVSDNKFADVDEDNLPDIVFARITANNASQLEVMITKFLDYERNPPTETNFYHHPITALGWQTERWFQICSEVVGGYFKEVLGKDPVRINAIYSGTPGTVWSTATNTSDVIDYFGPSRGLGYIPETPAELGGWSGGTTADVVYAINDGSFMLQHRDHGSYSGWGEPDFQSTDIDALTNVDNKLPFIFSINCQTGAFHRTSETFAEKFHRHTYDGQNSGALGVLAATEVSYSFVNDTFVWGVMDNMFPDFMPSETTEFPNNFVMPAFGNAAGKHFLYQSSWPYNEGDKLITYRLFHHHGDAFLNVYTEVPQELLVSHAPTLVAGTTTFNVTADVNSFIALTVDGEIRGIADGTGSSVPITIPAQFPPNQVLVTVTKQNYYRYSELVDVVSSNQAYVIYNSHLINDPSGNNDGVADYGEDITLDMILKNVGDLDAISVEAVLSTTDSYITITDDSQSYGSIAADLTSSQSDAFAFSIDSDIPDQHIINFDLEVTGTSSTRETWNSTFSITVNAPELTIDDMIIDDSIEITNGRLDPGETVDLIIPTNNNGHSNSPSAIGTLSCASGYITINGSNTHDFGVIDANSTENAVFNITVHPDTPIGANVTFDYNVTAGSYSTNETFNRMIGLIVEDFETNNFIFYPWTFGGDEDWTIIDIDPYEGTYCAKSGSIVHNQTSELIITGDVTADGDISFFRKVSSESTYDFLKFYIDGVEQVAWSGEVAWSEVSYPVTTGNRTFKWQYNKDGSVDEGSDCAWVDYIVFPAIYFPKPADITITPSSFEETLLPGGSSSDILTIGNAGELTLEYTARVSYVEPETENISYADKKVLSSNRSQISKPKSTRNRDYAMIGAGASTSSGTNDTPFGTFYHDGQNQYLFTASELSAAGLVAGDINGIGWNIASHAAQTMNGFNIDLKHTISTSVTGFETGFTNCYLGTWTASAGWNDISFSTPFTWDGTSNLLVKICFDNTSYTSNSSCYIDTYTAMNGWAYNDGTAGCSDPWEGTIDTRPQIRFDYTPGPTLNWLTLNGGSIVSGSIDSGSSDDVLSVLFDTVPDGLTDGIYEANITITSNDPDQPTITVPVTLTVSQQLDVPQNVTIATTPNGADVDVLISWTAVSGATSYTVYRSASPYDDFPSEWTAETGIIGTTWSYTTDRMYRFYRVTANN